MSERLTFTNSRSQSVPRNGAKADGIPVPLFAPLPPETRRIREHGDWAFTALLVFTALLYLRPQDAIPPLAIVPLAELAAITGLIAMAFGRLRHGLAITRITPELIGVVALGGIILATAPFSVWRGGALTTFTDLYAKVLLIFLLMVNTLTSPDRLRRFTWVVVLATFYVGFRAVFDYLRGFNLVENGRITGAVGGMFQNPNDLALNMVSMLPLAVLLALVSRRLTSRLIAGAAAFLMIVTTVMSQSRSGFLGLAVMLVILAVQVGRRRPKIMLAGIVALFLAMPLVPATYWSRMSSITDASLDPTGSREARRIILGEAWQTFLNRPFTGVGAGMFQAYNPEGRQVPWKEAHNVVLQVASELGIFGTAVFLFLVSRAAIGARQAKRLLRLATPGRRKGRSAAAASAKSPAVVTPEEAALLEAHGTTMTAAVAGWFFSALFASVAYHWTFYYLLALAIAPREILLDRLAGRSVPHSPVVRRSKVTSLPVPVEARL